MRTTAVRAGLALLVLAAGSTRGPVAAAAAGCEEEDVEYAVAANLRITGTIMGAGDGDHAVGPGKLVLHFTSGADPRGGTTRGIRMTSFELRQRFSVVSRALFLATTILTDIETRAVPDAHSVVAEGALEHRSLRWTRVTGTVRDDGTLLCSGSFCGKFGAPPTGTSPYHAGPSLLPFAPFEFGPDMKTFTMAPVLASKSEDPRQATYLTLAGREMRRTCTGEEP
jgi:hypothetical protein